VAYGQATPYGPILEILRANFQIEDGDNALQICEKLRQGVRRLDPALESLLPFLGDLFGLAAEDEALRHLDSKERRQKAFEAIRALTLAGSQRRPHVVIVEDLHWIDRTSEDYLAFLSDSVAGTPLLLVTTHRPGYAVRWAEKTYYTRIALGLLSEGEAEEMISGLLATRQAPRELLQVVLAKAEGNPLFVEELTAALLERGLLTRTEGRIPPAEVRELEIPATIQDIIRARIDRLEEPVKRTVQTAAVIGREFGLRLLARISEMAEEVQRYLDTLKHLELIHETRVFPELEYIFKHAVTQDVAYQSLLGQRRRELHGAIGRAMEELYADRLEEQAAILTYHYARSTCEDKAIEYALLAGDRAARLYATAEARAYYEQAHITAHAQAPSPEARRLEIDTILKLPTVAVTRQHFEGDLQSLEHALALAERLDDRPRLSRVLYWLGRIQYTMGRHDAGIEYAEKALDLAEALGDENLAAPPVNLLGRGRFMRGEYERVRGLLARNVQQMRTIGNRIEEATASGMLGLSHAQLGQFSEALAACEEGVRVAEAVGHLPTLAACLLYRGITSSHFGEWSPALRDFETALEAAERSGDVFRAFIIRANRGGWCYLLSGDHGRAIEELTQALALADRVGTRWFLGGWLGYLAEARLGAGDVAEALRLGREAVQIASESASPWEQSVAFRALAQALLAQDPPDSQGAEEAIGRAIAIQEGFQMKWELPQSLLVRGRVLRAQGHAAEARAVLDQALKLFEAMGVSWGVEKAEQALRDP
jgi:predicted ATPase